MRDGLIAMDLRYLHEELFACMPYLARYYCKQKIHEEICNSLHFILMT